MMFVNLLVIHALEIKHHVSITRDLFCLYAVFAFTDLLSFCILHVLLVGKHDIQFCYILKRIVMIYSFISYYTSLVASKLNAEIAFNLCFTVFV